RQTKNNAAAEPLFLRALAIDKKGLPPDHPDIATDLYNLGLLYMWTKRLEQSIPLFQQALEIQTKSLGPADGATVETMKNYSLVLQSLKREEEAKALDAKINAAGK